MDDRNLPRHRIPEPAVIRRVQVTTHELVFDDIITRVDLAMSLPLIVIPDPPASPGKQVWMDGSPSREDAFAAELGPASYPRFGTQKKDRTVHRISFWGKWVLPAARMVRRRRFR